MVSPVTVRSCRPQPRVGGPSDRTPVGTGVRDEERHKDGGFRESPDPRQSDGTSGPGTSCEEEGGRTVPRGSGPQDGSP